MKKILSWLGRPPVLLLLALFLLLLLCYLCWGLLLPGMKRQPLLLVVVAVVGLLAVAISAIPGYLQERRRRRAADGPIAEQLEQTLQILGEQTLSGVDRALRMPWVLVLGTPRAGKSSALASGSFARRVTDPRVKDPVCALWKVQTRGSVLVQPRGTSWQDEGAWDGILRWLQRRRPIDAVMLAISAPELLSPKVDLGSLGGRLAGRLRDVAQRLRAGVPLVLLVTQCDRMDGFIRFFSELAPREREQAWGFVLELGDAELVSARLLQRFSEQESADKALLAPLWARAQGAFRAALTSEERAAVLGFPAEMSRLAHALGTFLDALYPQGAGQGLPRMVEVCFTSTQQAGDVIAGARHEASARGQTVRARSTPSASPQVGPFFLRGALTRLLDRAAAASSPPLRWHAIALGLTIFLCAGASWLIGRDFAAHARWMARVENLVKEMASPPGLSTSSDDDVVRTELEREQGLARLLLEQRHEEERHGLTEEAHRDALRFLRCRAGSQLVAPIVEYNTSKEAQNRLYADLGKASALQRETRGKSLFQSFTALKAVVLLKKRLHGDSGQLNCPAPGPQDQDELVSYLSEMWGPRSRDRMRIGIRNFLSLYLADEATWPALTIKQDSVDAAQDNLRKVFQGGKADVADGMSDAAGVAEMYFYMRAQKQGLMEPAPLLGTDRTLKEPGVRPVFTASGCPSLFTKDDQWGAWLACVRGERVDGRAPDEALRSFYMGEYKRAWINWLSQIQQRQEIPLDPLRAAESLQGIGKDLRLLFSMAGRGRAGRAKDVGDGKGKAAKEGDKTAGKDDASISDPEVCVSARNMLAIFAYASGDDKVDADDQAVGAREALTGYDEALTGMRVGLGALADWKPSPDAAFLPYQAAVNALSTLTSRRQRLVTALGEPGLGLQRLLGGVEEDLRKVLVATLRRFLAEKWRALYEEWKNVRPGARPEGGGDAEAVRRFLDERVVGFARAYLDPLDETTRSLVICSSAVRDLAQVRRSSPAAPGAAAPAPAPAPAPPVAARPPMVTVPPERCAPPQFVLFDTGGAGRYRCEPSTHRCSPVPAAAPQPQPRALVQAQFAEQGRPQQTLLLADAPSLAALVSGRRTGERQQGLEAVRFQGPGTCQTRLYIDPSLLETGRARPTLRVNLPEKLTCP